MKILFVEPPKEFWFVMGEHLPPPFGILQLAAFLEMRNKNVEIEVLDCQAENLDWGDMEKRIESFSPDIVASSGLATCNTYTTVRTLETAKKMKPDVLTVVGGQHFTAMAQESLEGYEAIDVIVRVEGEETLSELVEAFGRGSSLSEVKGISFRSNGEVRHNPSRPLIEDLDALPFPGYHFVKNSVYRYHFNMMAANKRYGLIEGSRGCYHRCKFCTQWTHWGGMWRTKSAKRIADEIEFCYQNYGIRFFWLTDDNFGLDRRAENLCNEIIKRRLSDEIMWFVQARCDDVVNHSVLLPKMRKAGNYWMLLGVERHDRATLETFNKKIEPETAKSAIELLKRNDIFSQAMFIIGERKDTTKSIAQLKEFANDLDPDLAIFMILTPFPGTELFDEAKRKGWIEDSNWANYDMVHTIMPTETLSRREVQGELYDCYRDFYGSTGRRLKGLLSSNGLKRRTYRYLASQGLLRQMKNLF